MKRPQDLKKERDGEHEKKIAEMEKKIAKLSEKRAVVIDSDSVREETKDEYRRPSRRQREGSSSVESLKETDEGINSADE